MSEGAEGDRARDHRWASNFYLEQASKEAEQRWAARRRVMPFCVFPTHLSLVI